MTTQLFIEDAVLALMFLGMMALARESLRRRLVEADEARLAAVLPRRFFRAALVYVVVFMVCGVLHQTRTLLGWHAYVVFGFLLAIGGVGWVQLRRIPAKRGDK